MSRQQNAIAELTARVDSQAVAITRLQEQMQTADARLAVIEATSQTASAHRDAADLKATLALDREVFDRLSFELDSVRDDILNAEREREAATGIVILDVGHPLYRKRDKLEKQWKSQREKIKAAEKALAPAPAN